MRRKRGRAGCIGRRRRYEEEEGTRRVEAEGGAMRRKRGRAGWRPKAAL